MQYPIHCVFFLNTLNKILSFTIHTAAIDSFVLSHIPHPFPSTSPSVLMKFVGPQHVPLTPPLFWRYVIFRLLQLLLFNRALWLRTNFLYQIVRPMIFLLAPSLCYWALSTASYPGLRKFDISPFRLCFTALYSPLPFLPLFHWQISSFFSDLFAVTTSQDERDVKRTLTLPSCVFPTSVQKHFICQHRTVVCTTTAPKRFKNNNVQIII